MCNNFSNKPTMAARAEVLNLIRRLEMTDDENIILKGKRGECNKKAVYCKELDKYFESQKEAAEFFGCCPTRINQCLKRKYITVKTKYTLEII